MNAFSYGWFHVCPAQVTGLVFCQPQSVWLLGHLLSQHWEGYDLEVLAVIHRSNASRKRWEVLGCQEFAICPRTPKLFST